VAVRTCDTGVVFLHHAPERDRQATRANRTRALPTCSREAPMTSRFPGRYAKEFISGWGTMDFNGHLANTAYLDLAADVRMAFFAEHGFPPSEFRRLAIGPVVRRDELEYFREVGLHDTVTVTYAVLAMSADGARFVLENEMWTAAGERAAVVRSTGGWLDLRARRLVAPPAELLAAFEQVPRSPEFAELPSASGRSKRSALAEPPADDAAVRRDAARDG